MSDAAGELADRFKLLSALECDLGRAPVGNLADDLGFKGFVEISDAASARLRSITRAAVWVIIRTSCKSSSTGSRGSR